MRDPRLFRRPPRKQIGKSRATSATSADKLEDIKVDLRWAASIELATIPPYLTAMYSLKDSNGEDYRLMKAVVIEEMLHLALVCNLMASIGESPRFGPPHPSSAADDEVDPGHIVVPEYPGTLPLHIAEDVVIGLFPLSAGVAKDVFCQIEKPADGGYTGDQDLTIGEFYERLQKEFDSLEPADIVDPRGERQLDDSYYIGGGGGTLLPVTSKDDAREAIEQIKDQGEGNNPWRAGGFGQSWGQKFLYDVRPDGDYGPILNCNEPSHFERFRRIADRTVPVTGTRPMQPNPRTDALPEGSDVRRLSSLFDQAYSLSLHYLEAAYSGSDCRDLFLRGMMPVMHGVLPLLARKLMDTPLVDAANGKQTGRNAGPAFIYCADARDPRALEKAAGELKACFGPAEFAELMRILGDLPGLPSASPQSAK